MQIVVALVVHDAYEGFISILYAVGAILGIILGLINYKRNKRDNCN